jgi:hypothetical protein
MAIPVNSDRQVVDQGNVEKHNVDHCNVDHCNVDIRNVDIHNVGGIDVDDINDRCRALVPPLRHRPGLPW